jgi:hypothetical protein
MFGEKSGNPDELTMRLMALMNTRIDEDRLKRLHRCAEGVTPEDFEEYAKLWRLAEGVGAGGTDDERVREYDWLPD